MLTKTIQTYDIDEVAIWLNCIGLGAKASAFRENCIDGPMLLILTSTDYKDLGLTSLQAKKMERSIDFTKTLQGQMLVGNATKNDSQERIQELQAQIDRLENENQDLKKHVPSAPVPQAVPVLQATALNYGTNTNTSNHAYQQQPYVPNQKQQPPTQQAHGQLATTYSYPSTTEPYVPSYTNKYTTVPVTTTTCGNAPSNTNTCTNSWTTPAPVTPTKKSSGAMSAATGAVTGAAVGTAKGAVGGAIVGAVLPGMSAGDGAKAGAAGGAAMGGMRGILRGARRR